jgi:X-Pro dipeptidyl-peptidase C-terminal non-catalytic domain/X-Pro dipeptidyl-peptidase (S15 family)
MAKLAVGVAVLAALATLPASAGAAPLDGLDASCRPATSDPPNPVAYRICSAMVPSFDGTPLDVTVTVPAHRPRHRRLPLIVFLHGLLNSKGEYISQTLGGTGPDRGGDAYKTVRWNNVWFASRGYAVLNYSARGNGDSGGQLDLASKALEVRDTRYLTGLLADDRGLAPIAARRTALIGGSYGGGQAWLLMTTRAGSTGQFGQWRSPAGRLVRVAAVLPGFTWTDLLYSIAPNGQQSSSGVINPLVADSPLGIEKQSIVSGFILSANTKFSPQIYQWLARANAGEPYDPGNDPLLADTVSGLTYDRSAYFQNDFFDALRGRRQRSIPVFAAQGWTDPIFHPIEALRMYRRLRSIRPRYPIKLYFGDMEHLVALDKVSEFRYYHTLGNRFIDHYLRRHGPRPRFDVRASVSNCDPKRFGPVVAARGWDGLATGQREFDLGGPQVAVSPLADPRGVAADPVVASQLHGRGCLTTDLPATPGVATYTVPITDPFTLIGLPRLTLSFTSTAPDTELNSRLWDVAPDGTQTLVTRGARREVGTDVGARTITYELFGNAWRFEAGHRLMLEVAPDDAPYLRADNFPATVTIENAKLELPVR